MIQMRSARIDPPLTQVNFGTAGSATHLGEFTGPLTRIQDHQGTLGSTAVIVGANACGKSTLLRGLARLLRPQSGAVLLDGEVIHRQPTKQVARVLGLEKTAASNRYVRALERLKKILTGPAGGQGGMWP